MVNEQQGADPVGPQLENKDEGSPISYLPPEEPDEQEAAETETGENPYLLFCPYLPIDGTIAFAGWQLTPIDAFQGPWLSSQFEDRAKTFLAAFQDANGKRLERPALLTTAAGADGKLPSRNERLALQGALDFCTLDGNVDRESDNAGWATATSDNSQLFIWPIDLARGYVTITRGLMVQISDGGYRIGENLVVRAPIELHIPWSVRLDSELLNASYSVFLGGNSDNGADLGLRLRGATNWLAKAWWNTQNIRWEDRIVFMKTAFEALTGKSTTWAGARALRAIFDQFNERHHPSPQSVDHLLWSPDEQEHRERRWTDERSREHTAQVIDLEHWYCAFADARNQIVHEGRVPGLSYVATGSNYGGPFIHTGDRLLREAIRVLLDGLGYPDLWRDQMGRAVARGVRELGIENDDHDGNDASGAS